LIFVRSVAWVISIAMAIRAIGLPSVVRATPLISVILMPLALSG
jgi:hypothetical protein